MSNSPLTPPPISDANSKVGDLITPNTKDKVLPPLCKTVWKDNKMRKHTDGGDWECLWCGFNTMPTNHTKALSQVAKVKLLGVNVSLFAAKIPDS